MNIKKEFVSAIISLFRLEKNVFIIGAIEKIVEDVEPQDYVMFLAFLGDRESEYERPIESINQAVKEYYNKKDGKKLIYACLKAKGIGHLIRHIYEKNLLLEPKYGAKVQSGEYTTEEIKLTSNDIELINNMGGIGKLAVMDFDELYDILKEKYFGKKFKKTITEKIEDNGKKEIGRDLKGLTQCYSNI